MAKPVLRTRINQVDWTLAKPSVFDYAPAHLHQVPVLRIFGQTSVGAKACVHVHQVYPYFYIDYLGSLDSDSVNQYVLRLGASLNHAIALSLKCDPKHPTSQFVRAIVLVKGVHFYGFHYSYSPFLKIHIVNPHLVTRAVALLSASTVMGTKFKVYESHLNFVLQFLCDFGLFGCSWLDIAHAALRQSLFNPENGNRKPHPTFAHSQSPLYKESSLPIEIDLIAPDILNRHLLEARDMHHLLSTTNSAPAGTLIQSVKELWDDERRRRTALQIPPPESQLFAPSSESREYRESCGDWAFGQQHWEELDIRIESERHFANQEDEVGTNWEPWTITASRSAEVLWEKKFRTWKPMNPVGEILDPTLNPYDRNLQVDPLQDGAEIELSSSQLLDEVIDNLVEESERTLDISNTDGAGLDAAHLDEPDDNFFHPDDEEVPSLEEEPPPLPGDLSFSAQSTAAITEVRDITDKSGQEPVEGQEFGNLWNRAVYYREGSAESVTSEEQLADRDAAVLDTFAGSILPVFSGSTPVSDTLKTGIPQDTGIGRLASTSNENGPYNLMEIHSRAPIMPPLPDKVVAENEFTTLSNDPRSRRSNFSGNRGPSTTVLLPSLSLSLLNQQDKVVLKKVTFAQHESQGATEPVSTGSGDCYRYSRRPPSRNDIRAAATTLRLPSKIYLDPYYFCAVDAPLVPQKFGATWHLLQGGDGPSALRYWQPNYELDGYLCSVITAHHCESGWEFCGVEFPPSQKMAASHLSLSKAKSSNRDEESQPKDMFQKAGPTVLNRYGFKSTPHAPGTSSSREHTDMTVMAVEVFAPSQPGSDGRKSDGDMIAVVAYTFRSGSDEGQAESDCNSSKGILAVSSSGVKGIRHLGAAIDVVETELDLLNGVVDLVRLLDPDILVGWELQASSWGYLSARAREYDMDFGDAVSRAPERSFRGQSEQWLERQLSTFSVVGRHVFNVWRVLRGDLALTSYTFENVAFAVLRKRFPKFAADTLSFWYNGGHPSHLLQLVKYLLARTSYTLEILKKCETVTKSAEFARICGIDFFSVLSRGSQYKVESFMLRLAKPESLIMLSPSRADVGTQNAAEAMPLIMEPRAAFYKSPLLVLDFQSLYPSMMIAYNYCYTTCVGRIKPFKTGYKFGVLEDLKQVPGLLEKLRDHLIVAPNGVLYTKPNVRVGLLSRMLTELLTTRVMIKESMALVVGDKILTKQLDARQISLKFVCNVTYGYTSASFSGRMPAVEIADSIVQSGRETLEKAIVLIDSISKWGAKVVYGDTDSIFVSLPGKTKAEAFSIGKEIAAHITGVNPAPVRLKFEKVYFPCVLLAKKRYVGLKFETLDQRQPTFDAKGIETIRRDGVPAQAKLVEQTLKLLFRTRDLSAVKNLCISSWGQVLEDKCLIKDYIFAKEVRLGTYSDKLPPPPGAAVAMRRISANLKDEPQYGERIPYVITKGGLGALLVERAFSPEELLGEERHRELDAEYYIMRVLIPPLERIFNLVGADVRDWYEELRLAMAEDELEAERIKEMLAANLPEGAEDESSIDNKTKCVCCGQEQNEELCSPCRGSPKRSTYSLSGQLRSSQHRRDSAIAVCRNCCEIGVDDHIDCVSLECDWMFQRGKLGGQVNSLQECTARGLETIEQHGGEVHG